MELRGVACVSAVSTVSTVSVSACQRVGHRTSRERGSQPLGLDSVLSRLIALDLPAETGTSATPEPPYSYGVNTP